MVLMYTVAIVLATVVVQRFYRRFLQWNQEAATALSDPEERRRLQEEERDRAYAALQSRIRRADRERREAEDQLMELEESSMSQRRRGGRLRRTSERSRTPSLRSQPSSRQERYTSEEECRTQRYASRTPDYDEESQRGGSADDRREDPDEHMGIWREEHEDENRSTPEEGTRATAEQSAKGMSKGRPTTGSASGSQDLSRHQELRDLESYERSRQEEAFEELRRQHLREERREIIWPRGPDDSSETRGTPTVYTTPTSPWQLERSPPHPLHVTPSTPVQPEEVEEEGGLQDQELPGVEEGLALLEEPSSDDTPADIAGPAHYLDELRDVFDPDAGERYEEGEEEEPIQRDPPLPEPDDEPQGEVEGVGAQGGEVDQVPRGLFPDYVPLLTPTGARYHVDRLCCTLANTRRLIPSVWCQHCGRVLAGETPRSIFVREVGGVAHLSSRCPVLNGPPYMHFPECQRCGVPRG